MNKAVKVTAGFPSAAKAAKTLGVSKKMARDLAALAGQSLNAGQFVLPSGVKVTITAKPRKRPGSGKIFIIETTKRSVKNVKGPAYLASHMASHDVIATTRKNAKTTA